MKSWNDRLNTPVTNGEKPTPRTVAGVIEGQPTVRQVDDFIRSIREGAEVTCPVTSDYHNAANEDLGRGVTLTLLAHARSEDADIEKIVLLRGIPRRAAQARRAETMTHAAQRCSAVSG